MTLIQRLKNGIEKYFHRRSEWIPHEQFMQEFMKEHEIPYWSDEHGQKHYHFMDGLQVIDMKRLEGKTYGHR